MANAVKRIDNHLVERIAAELVRVEHFRAGSVVSTPIMYPSGSFVAVQVTESGSKFFVTDMGLGMQEAEMMGVSLGYRKIARSIADAAGVGFDSSAFFETEVQVDELASAIAIIGNCSSEAAKIAAYNMKDDSDEDDAATEALYEKLIGIFSPKQVQKNFTLKGSSQHAWKVSTFVESGGNKAIFEPVKNHPSSIYAVATKFQDIGRLMPPPNRISVVHNMSEFDTYLGVLNQAGSVIEDQSAPDSYLKLVA